MIAGFILGATAVADNIIVRGIGPSLTALWGAECAGRSNAGAAQQQWSAARGRITTGRMTRPKPRSLAAAGLAPTNPLESGIAATLSPGQYTAILAGLNNGTGVGLVEVYDLGNGAPVPSPTPGGHHRRRPQQRRRRQRPRGDTVADTTANPNAGNGPTPAGPCVENFDGVTAPALPAGWAATNPDPGDGILWVTSTVTPDSAPNDAFIPDQDGISDKVLDRMGVTITSAAAMMSFRNNFNTEFSGGSLLGWVCAGSILAQYQWGRLLGHNRQPRGGKFCERRLHWGDRRERQQPAGGENGVECGFRRLHRHGGKSGTEPRPDKPSRCVSGWASDEAVAAPGVRIDTISITGASCP